MSERNEISGFARRFVERKLEQFRKEANKGCGLYYELYAQNFTDAVDSLASRAKRTDLREYIRGQAEKSGDYVPSETGRWKYDYQLEDVRFCPAERPSERLLSRIGRSADNDGGEKHTLRRGKEHGIER
jgi:hypothetical protein